MMGEEEFPGTYKFGDVLDMAEPAGVAAVHDIRKQLQFDDPINIQFTSVRSCGGLTSYSCDDRKLFFE